MATQRDVDILPISKDAVIIDCMYISDEMRKFIRHFADRSQGSSLDYYCLHGKLITEKLLLGEFCCKSKCVKQVQQFLCDLAYNKYNNVHLITDMAFHIDKNYYACVHKIPALYIWTSKERESSFPRKPWWIPKKMKVSDFSLLLPAYKRMYNPLYGIYIRFFER